MQYVDDFFKSPSFSPSACRPFFCQRKIDLLFDQTTNNRTRQANVVGVLVALAGVDLTLSMVFERNVNDLCFSRSTIGVSP